MTVAALVASPVLGQETSESRKPPTLESLQKQIDDLGAAQQLYPTLGSNRSTMQFFGRIHLDAWSIADSDRGSNAFETGDSDVDPRNEIEFRRARIGVSGDIIDDMFYKIEFEFGHPSELSASTDCPSSTP